MSRLRNTSPVTTTGRAALLTLVVGALVGAASGMSGAAPTVPSIVPSTAMSTTAQSTTAPPSTTASPATTVFPATTVTTTATSPAVPPSPTASPTTPTLPVADAGPREVRVLVAGDILPHTPVVRAACGPTTSRDADCDFERLLGPTSGLVSAADLAICHLEVPIAPPGKAVSGYPTFGAPVELAEAIAATGWDRCSTASNHSIDKGAKGIDATLAALDASGLGHSGSARTAEEAAITPIVEVNGVRVAHLSYAYGLNGLRLPKGEPWRVNLINVPKILADAGQARIEGAQIVLVSLHWGQEYRSAVTTQQRAVATALMNSGLVDLIIGHHAHVVQPIERINGRWVVFGLGNHLSAQVASKTRPVATQDGLMVSVVFAEQPDGTFAATGEPDRMPTWVHPTSRIVYPVAEALADPSLSGATRRILEASQKRTLKVSTPVG